MKLKEITWFDIEYSSGISKMQRLIANKHGYVPEKDWDKSFEIIEKYFRSWDQRVAYQSNNDHQYSPPLFAWYVHTILGNTKYTRPIDIMRVCYDNLKGEYLDKYLLI